MARKLSIRTAERLIRAAYDFESLAARLRADGHDYYANSVRDIAHRLGGVGRTMGREAETGER